MLINTAGGLAGGDRLSQRFSAAPGSAATATTQACERIYRSEGPAALVRTEISVAAGAEFSWLPQETIVFDGGRLDRRLEVDLGEDSSFTGLESVILGREAMGETVRRGTLTDRWRIRRDGRLVFADQLRLDGDISALAGSDASLGGHRAFAMIVHQGRDPGRKLDDVRLALPMDCGASLCDGLLLIRILAPDNLVLRHRLCAAFAALGLRRLPAVWSS